MMQKLEHNSRTFKYTWCFQILMAFNEFQACE